MKKRLQKIYWTGILITLIMAFAAIGLAAKFKIDDTRSSLTAMLMAASEWTLDSNDDLQTLAVSIAQVSEPMEVTFLLESGLVLADSAQDEDLSVNHLADREIREAREGRIGRNIRMAGANGTFVMYMARRISPQLILRVSYPVFEIAKVIVLYGLLLLVLFLILYYLQRKAVTRFAREQERQMEEVRRLLDGEIEEARAVFPEYQPELDMISYRVRRLKEDHQEVLRTMRLRSDFIANASHELRSPLTSVRGFAEMIREGMTRTEEERELALGTILSECDRMLAVIEDILHLNRTEREEPGEQPLLSAAPTAQEIVRALSLKAAAKEITVHVTGDTYLRIREQDLWEIFYNLTDNAIRYGSTGGRVDIVLTEGQITVEDDGGGISAENLPRIFEPFFRADETRESSGTGLGLSIVKAIVERYGGTITAQSRSHEWTRFTIRFPQLSDDESERMLPC